MGKLHAVKTTVTAFGTRKMIVFFLIISLAVFSGPAFADQASKIDELEFISSDKACKECHRETHKGWKKSWHGRSVVDPRVLRTWRTFILNGLDRSEASRRDLKDICLPCHAPQTKDASDDLIREIAGMIITAVEEIDNYKTEDEPPPSETPEDLTMTVLEDEDRSGTEYKMIIPKEEPESEPADALIESPWIRAEIDEDEDIMFELFKEPVPYLFEDNALDEAVDTYIEPINNEVIVEVEDMVEDEGPVTEPAEDFTVSFVEDGYMPIEPTEEVKDMTATLVLDNGEVKIEYSPYDPGVDQKEPTFLDKGITKGEIAMEELSKLNINCMICHSMKALPGGNPRPRTIYGTSGSGSIEHKEALGAETRISGFMKTSEFCAQCHHGCPPGMPSSICPTLWTSYKESYIARGGDKTCQDCHMEGADKKSHRFPGIYEEETVKKGIKFTLDAEPTRYIYHLENRIVPAVVITVNVTNTAGHGIPHGCTYIPQTAQQVSVTDQNGNELFYKDKTYEVYNLHLPDNREGYLGLNDWDITAMNRLNLGIDPGDTDSSTYVVPLNEDTTSVVIEAVFKYLYEDGVSAIIHKENREIEFEIEKKSPRM